MTSKNNAKSKEVFVMDIPFLINKKLNDTQAEQLLRQNDEKNPILFAVIGDLNDEAVFNQTALLATADSYYTYNFVTDTRTEPVMFDDIDQVYTKRMYSNGLLRAKMKDGTTLDVYRFSFSIAALCDAAMNFVSDMKRGESLEDALAAIDANYTKLLSICPRCGRTLSAPGVQCVQCMGKRNLIMKFAKYILPEWKNLILSVLISIASTGISLLPPLLTAKLVDTILAQKVDITAAERRHMLFLACIGLLSIYVVQHVLGGFRGYRLRISGDRIIAKLRCDVYEKAQHLPMRFYDKTSTGSVINRINGDTATLQSYMLRITQEAVVQAFSLVGIIIIMIILNWKLALLSLTPIPFIVVGARIFGRKIEPFYRRIWIRATRISSTLTDTLPGIRVIKSFTNEENSSKKFYDTVEDWRKTSTRAGKILNIYPQIIGIVVNLGTLVIWSLGGNMVIRGMADPNSANAITVGMLVSFISYASMFYNPVNFFANLADATQSAMVSAERIMDILDAEPEHDFGKGNTNVDMGGQIVFSNVNFSFDRTKKVLRNINLTIDPGDIVGIVGTTGSGKSTLINLLLRYYDHYEGTITVGGVDIRTIDMKFYRSSIGYVQQEPMMFYDTIYNNISYGDPTFTKDEIINAADIANAHQFIARHPDGYDCVLGERGTGLSGGERQRISIARAVLRNPKMLIFDEATASVDSETEHLIQEAIEHLISGRTTIMIAHRLSTLSKANKIVVVDNGEIIECGTPQELMDLKGKYYRLVQIQTMSDKVAQSKREENFE